MVVTAVLDEEKASSETEKPARRKRPLAHHSLAHNAAAAIMVATTAVALVCVAAFAAASYAVLDSRASDGIADESHRFASYIDETQLDGEDLVDFLDEQAMLMGGDMRITLISNDGTVLFDNDVTDVSTLESHAGRPEFVQAEINGESSAGRYSETLQEVTLYHSVRLHNDDVLRFATTQSSVWGMMLHMLGPCAVVVALALIAAAVGSRFLAQVISADLMRIDLDRPLESDAPVELAPLLMRLDAQHKRLEAQASERRQYTANVSHELKTPLTVISGYAEIIAAGIAKDEDVKSFAHTIHSESQRMRSMVDDIISLSKLDDMGKGGASGDDLGVDMNQTVSLESLANDACERLRPYAEDHRVSLTCEIERSGNEPVVVRGNTQILSEMVRNLVENAIRYNVEGGCARVAIIGAVDGSAIVRMSDTGIGIPLELRERVFERFFRVDESRSKETGGSGLGLAIVKHAAQVHGAKISVMGNEPQGTIIEVHFPAK
ncbi:ATP-binding protein [uncultured Slackia sp.]|uniref:sensor histidine kinase n=1 Tax=uncultured Slackia sp. TaxID=665903 RepID=UPI0025845E69|nr:ATP-binding protein [uncultured Slackia sp.]